jgi:glyoxylase I family protein
MMAQRVKQFCRRGERRHREGTRVRIDGVLHAGVLVVDTGRALAFYHEVLGLAVDTARPDLGYPGAWLRVGMQQIHLMELPGAGPRPDQPAHGGRDRHLALAVSDLDALRERLGQAGVSYTLSRSGRKALFCRDPDGNALEFVQRD